MRSNGSEIDLSVLKSLNGRLVSGSFVAEGGSLSCRVTGVFSRGGQGFRVDGGVEERVNLLEFDSDAVLRCIRFARFDDTAVSPEVRATLRAKIKPDDIVITLGSRNVITLRVL